MELSIDAGTQRFVWGDPFFWQRERPPSWRRLKLVRIKLEEHVGRFMLFDLDQNRSFLPQNPEQLIHHLR
jgi:hypothetical protein